MKKTIALLFCIAMVASSCNESAADKGKNFDANFVHTVFFWLKNPNNSNDRLKFETSLRHFLENSNYAKTNFIGTPPVATREVVDGSFTYSLVVTFASAKAQEGYQKEAAHLKFIEECKDLWTKVIVYDSNGIPKEIKG